VLTVLPAPKAIQEQPVHRAQLELKGHRAFRVFKDYKVFKG
jgi:hypothetical protein